MTCKNCNIRNPIGNKFCRECGERLSIPEGSLAAEEAARAENERRTERAAILLSDAYLLAEQGKYLGAIPIAEEVANTMPQSTSAYTLLATLFEHTDQMEKAIVAQERVVALNPDSPADANRLERMRRGEKTTVAPAQTSYSHQTVPTLRGSAISSAPRTVASSSPLPVWFPIAASAIGGGFVLFLGFLALTPGSAFNRRTTTTPITPVPTASVAAPASTTPPLTNLGATAPPIADATRGGDPFVPLDATRRALQNEAAQRGAANAGSTANPTNTASGVSTGIASNATLPDPKKINSVSPPTRANTAPVIVSTDLLKSGNSLTDNNSRMSVINAGPPSSDSGNNSGDGTNGSEERIAAGPPAGGNEGDSASRPSTGYMRISVGPPSSRPAPIPVAAPRSPDKSADMDGDPMRRARTLQNMGRYTDAVGAYREAIAAGASAGDANQSIGLCYQRLGDNNGARTAYRQAISSYESQIASGRSVAAAQRGINSSKAALEVLGGE